MSSYWVQKSLPYHAPFSHSYYRHYDVSTNQYQHDISTCHSNDWSQRAVYGSLENLSALCTNTTTDMNKTYTVNTRQETRSASGDLHTPSVTDPNIRQRQLMNMHQRQVLMNTPQAALSTVGWFDTTHSTPTYSPTVNSTPADTPTPHNTTTGSFSSVVFSPIADQRKPLDVKTNEAHDSTFCSLNSTAQLHTIGKTDKFLSHEDANKSETVGDFAEKSNASEKSLNNTSVWTTNDVSGAGNILELSVDDTEPDRKSAADDKTKARGISGGASNKKSVCKYCSTSCFTFLALCKHQKECKLNTSRYCQVCDKHFKTTRSHTSHMTTQHATSNECSVCHMRMPTARALRQHMSSHKPTTKAHTCFRCGASFATRYRQQKHLKTSTCAANSHMLYL